MFGDINYTLEESTFKGRCSLMKQIGLNMSLTQLDIIVSKIKTYLVSINKNRDSVKLQTSNLFSINVKGSWYDTVLNLVHAE